jgi:hypothetical protein
MKKSKPSALQPRKLVLRREAIAQLTRSELDHVVGGDPDGGCSLRPQSCNHSNLAVASCVAIG